MFYKTKITEIDIINWGWDKKLLKLGIDIDNLFESPKFGLDFIF